MIHCYQPPYRREYGISRKQWIRMSGLEKTKAIKEYRDRCNAEHLALTLSGEDGCLLWTPYFHYEPFEPYEENERDDYW